MFVFVSGNITRSKKTPSNLTPDPMGKKAQNEVTILTDAETSAFTEPGEVGHIRLSGMTFPRSESLSSPSSCLLYLLLLGWG